MTQGRELKGLTNFERDGHKIKKPVLRQMR